MFKGTCRHWPCGGLEAVKVPELRGGGVGRCGAMGDLGEEL